MSTPLADPSLIDRLPPHAEESEAAVLGCILMSPADVLPKIEAWCGEVGEHVFYMLKNQIIFRAMLGLRLEGAAVDVITLQQRLKDTKRLEEAGGIAYLSSLPDFVVAETMVDEYMKIVWAKFLARAQVATSTQTISEIYQWNGLSEGLWARVQRFHEDWRKLAERNTGVAPRELIRPASLEDDYKAQWMRTKADEKGWKLPFELADFHIRPYEFTILGGDSETGKSTWLKELIVCLIKQNIKCLLCTLEEPAAKALWILSRQILGTHKKPETPAEEQAMWDALAYLDRKLWIYNFLGIGNWRSILDSFIYAAEILGVQVFILDGLGLIGIGDEDMEAQGLAAAQFAAFAHTRPVHVIGVQHTVKDTEGGFKKRIRGNKRWTDFCDNLVEWERNEKKRETLTKLLADRDKNLAQLKAGLVKQDDFNAERERIAKGLDGLNKDHDAKCTLRKQKWGEGERRNAARYLWHDWSSRQFHDAPGQGAVNYLMK